MQLCAWVSFQQTLPSLTSPDERAMVVLNRAGDFAVVKARWVGFKKRQVPTSGTV